MSMAMSICRDKNIAKDLVQDMYLRLNRYIDNPEKIMKNDEVNSFFVYITLRNLFYDYKKDTKKKNDDPFNMGLKWGVKTFLTYNRGVKTF